MGCACPTPEQLTSRAERSHPDDWDEQNNMPGCQVTASGGETPDSAIRGLPGRRVTLHASWVERVPLAFDRTRKGRLLTCKVRGRPEFWKATGIASALSKAG